MMVYTFFWSWHTQVVLEKRPLNGCLSSVFPRNAIILQPAICSVVHYSRPRIASAKWHLDPSSHLATTDMGEKSGVGGCAPLGAKSPSNTTWPGQKPTFIPSDILIHPAVWPQKCGGVLCSCFRGAGSPSNTDTQCGLTQGLPPYQLLS